MRGSEEGREGETAMSLQPAARLYVTRSRSRSARTPPKRRLKLLAPRRRQRRR